MLKEVDEKEWEGFCNQVSDKTLLNDPGFLKTLQSVSGERIVYFIWVEDGKPAIGFPVFVDGRNIVQPFYKFYHRFSVHPEFTDADLFAAYKAIFSQLKERYKVIRWKVSVRFSYLNAFEEAGFRVSKRQTYIKSLNDLTYSRNINRILKRSEDMGYEVKLVPQNSAALLDLIQTNTIYWGIRKRQKNIDFMRVLVQQGYGEVYELTKAGTYIAALYIFNDKLANEIFTLFLSKRVDDSLEAHTLLYNHVMELYQSKGYLSCDLSGANMPAIAHYKAKFKGDLVEYCEVECGDNLKMLVKSYLKKIYSKF